LSGACYPSREPAALLSATAPVQTLFATGHPDARRRRFSWRIIGRQSSRSRMNQRAGLAWCRSIGLKSCVTCGGRTGGQVLRHRVSSPEIHLVGRL
jgi:hypothetical protein